MLHVSSENHYFCHFASLPVLLDTKSVVSRPVLTIILLSGEHLSTAAFHPGLRPLTATPPLSRRLESQRLRLRLNRLDGSGPASTARLYQVDSTAPA